MSYSGHSPGHTFGEWCGPFGKHLLCLIYTRPWWAPWRKVHRLVCFECDLEIEDPHVRTRVPG